MSQGNDTYYSDNGGYGFYTGKQSGPGYNSQRPQPQQNTPGSSKNLRGSAITPAYSDNYYHTPDGGLRQPKNTSSDTQSENIGDDSGSPTKGIKHLVSKYADKCSMNGVPYIKLSKNPIVKFVWSVLLLVAVCAMGYHLYKLFDTFYEYKKQTRVQLSFNSLALPAVTVCNVNPMRISKRELASEDLDDFIEEIDPSRIAEQLDDWEPEYEEDDDDYYDGSGDLNLLSRNVRKLVSRSKRATATVSSSSSKSTRRSSNFIDSINFTVSTVVEEREDALEAYDSEADDDSWESEATKSGSYEIEETFTELFVYENRITRARMGHQIADILLQCSFAGRKCFARNFTRIQNNKYGNCYTLQYEKFISKASGPNDGLELTFYLEGHEYIPGIAASKGLQLVIHDQGTLPFPAQEGFSARAGSETSIALRRLQIERIGKPHGECVKTSDFQKQYLIKYTRTACLKICAQLKVREACGCFDANEQETNRVLKFAKNESICWTAREVVCAARVNDALDNDACGCNNPCNEVTFQKIISSRIWPTPSYTTLLKSTVCKHSNDSCNALNQMDERTRGEEFIKLKIFYEDLNYEELVEEADYEIDQFLSDVGGTVGLWIGLSILSIFELFHLLVDVIIYVCGGRWKHKQQERYRNGNPK